GVIIAATSPEALASNYVKAKVHLRCRLSCNLDTVARSLRSACLQVGMTLGWTASLITIAATIASHGPALAKKDRCGFASWRRRSWPRRSLASYIGSTARTSNGPISTEPDRKLSWRGCTPVISHYKSSLRSDLNRHGHGKRN